MKVRTVQPRPNADAIRSARRICKAVERGEIMTVGWVYVSRGGSVSTGWDAAPGDTHKLCSGAASLSYRCTKALDESTE